MNSLGKYRGPERVAEYFVVVSADEEELIPCQERTQLVEQKVKNVFGIPFHAFVTDRYPTSDRPDFALPEGMPLFCLPKNLEIAESLRRPSFHSFVHTSEDGGHTHGCCLTFYEALTSGQRRSLLELVRVLVPPEREDGSSELEERLQTKPLYLPKCLCLVSRWPFVASFKQFLCGLYRISLAPTPIPIERIVCNFLDDVPAPPAGRVDITYYLGEQALNFRCPPANEPRVWSGLPLFPLFECLSPEKVLELFALVVTERQVRRRSLLACIKRIEQCVV